MKKEKAVCFGAGGGGERLFYEISEKYDVVAFTDNDSRKWGTTLKGIPVIPVFELIKIEYDVVILTSAPGKDSIIKQLTENYGINKRTIVTGYIDAPLESRRIFLKNLSIMQQKIDQKVCVAEVGVFQGDFAKYINEYYPDRKLHLFDTFDGFCEKDIEYEKNKDYSRAKKGDYSNTSISLVMEKMRNKEKVNIHEGIFPESANGIEDEFCFINLDLDLYLPTYNGLCFFENKIVKDGCILVHDYFAKNFKGPKEAVDRFIGERNGYYELMPIGDGISVLISGFGR